jgi:hypothetical protein
LPEFPSYHQVDQSPRPPDQGVAVALGSTYFERGAPAALYGAFQIDGSFKRKCGGDALAWISIIVIGRDLPDVWVAPAVRRERLRLPEPEAPSEPPPTFFRAGGYFNLDLRKHRGLPDTPGRYWLIVALGDHVTERMSFELR